MSDYRDTEEAPVKEKAMKRLSDWVSENYEAWLVMYIPALLFAGIGILLTRSCSDKEVRLVVCALTAATCIEWVRIIKKIYK